MLAWFLRHGLAGWFLLSLIWGILTIGYDAAIEILAGNEYTISWQTQQVSSHNPIIPAAIGFVVFGLAIHFFKVRELPLLSPTQPLWAWLIGGLLGGTLTFLYWTQRGG